MKLPAFITEYKQRRARRRYERDKARRGQQGEDAMDRIADGARAIGLGTLPKRRGRQ